MNPEPGKKNKYQKGIRLKLFTVFLRIGFFTFGGGYAMLPLIHNEIVEKKKWVDDDTMVDMLAISQTAPGAFSINLSSFLGCHLGGFWGSVIGTLGTVLPSFLIILVISYLFDAFRVNPWVDAAFMGIRAGVVVLIINAVLKLASKTKWKIFNIALCLAAFALNVLTGMSIIYILLCAGAAGLVYSLITASKLNGGKG